MKKLWKFLVLALFCAALFWVLWANTALELNTISLQDANLPAGFDGYRIAHISDFHNAANMTDDVLESLEAAKPDIICITGDLIDSRLTNIEAALNLVEGATKIAPCYYITGNHESRLKLEAYESLLDGLTAKNVTVLDDEQVMLDRNGEQIALVGHFWGDTKDVGSISDFDGYRILLSHQPEAIDDYVAAGYNLVLSGHAHGGQFRLPFVGGLFAPGQGLFPKYDAGVFNQENTAMVVSRGIGNSLFPIRINNRPEVILIELKCLTA